MMRPLSKHMLSVSEVCRAEIAELGAELGEIGATFLAFWLIVVVAVLIGLMVFLVP